MTLDEYFAVIDAPGFAALGLLPRDRAIDLTEAMRGHPVVDLLQGQVLDDPETSNHHLLLGRAPLTGRVLYLTHDGDSRVVFDSLADFIAAVRQADEQGLDVEELHPDLSPLVDGQPPLGGLIRELLQQESGVDVVLTLIPSLDLGDLALLEALARDDDFFPVSYTHLTLPTKRIV